jgi:hypothetical protein
MSGTAPEHASQALATAARALRESARETAPGSARASTGLAALADDLERAARSPREAGARLDDLERSVSAARTGSKSPSTARALDLAERALAEARRAGAARSPEPATGAASAGSRAGGADGAEIGGTGGPGSSPTSGSQGALAQSAADGRMSAPNADPTAATGPAAGAGAAERGVGAARWWPPAYDAVVERWLAGGGDASGH